MQFDKSEYSTIGRSSCLVRVQWMKDQSGTVNPCLLNACIALVHSYGWGDLKLRPPSPVICKSHEL